MEFLLTAEAFPAERALELGLLNEIVAEDELLDQARDWAARITANAPLAVQATKESVLRGLATDMREAYKIESELGAVVFGSEDAKEGPKAFAEKRAAELAGEVARRGGRPPEPRASSAWPQYVSRPEDGPCPEPLAMWEQVVRDGRRRRPGDAATCCGRSTASRSSTARAGSTTTPGDRLAEALGIDPRAPPLLRASAAPPRRCWCNDLGRGHPRRRPRRRRRRAAPRRSTPSAG